MYSISSNTAFRALAPHRSTHHAYLVWRLLEMFGDGTYLPSTAGMAAMVGLSNRAVQAAFTVLQSLGVLYRAPTEHRRARTIYLHPFGESYSNDVLRALMTDRFVVKNGGMVVDQTTHQPPKHPEWKGAPRRMDAPGFTHPDELTRWEQATSANEGGVGGFCTMLVLCRDVSQSAMNNASSEVPLNNASTATDSPETNQTVGPGGRPPLPITDDMRLVHANWAKAVGRTNVRALRSGAQASNIRGRLADGFTVEELQLIAEWAVQDRWLSGQHPQATRAFTGIDTLYRSRDRTENYLSQALAWRAGSLGGFDRRALALSAETPSQGTDSF